MLEQDGKDDGGDKGGDKPNWLSWVGDELKKSPIAVVVTLFVGMLWTFQREIELKNSKIRIEMLTRLLDMEYHDDYITRHRTVSDALCLTVSV